MPTDLELELTPVLSKTPATLRAMLGDVPERWVRSRERPETWTPFDVLGHLIHGERTDWIPRARVLLERGPEATFEPFDRFAQFEASRGKTPEDLLDEFARLRAANLVTLAAMNLGEADLERKANHPALGVVTLGELLSTWVVHDLGHIAQIARGMAALYRRGVGPWREYLPVLAAATD